MRRIMEKVTGNMVKSVILGLVVAALTQSSSATTVMVVGFVNAGLLTLRQSVGIIMGANIGTTVTAWLVSLNDIPGGTWYLDMLKPDTLAPIALIIGAVLLFISSDKHKTRTIVGEVIVGLGILFIGMNYMSSSMQIVFDEVPALQQLFSRRYKPVPGDCDWCGRHCCYSIQFCLCGDAAGDCFNRGAGVFYCVSDYYGTEYRYLRHRTAV